MSVRAKFTVTSITRQMGSASYQDETGAWKSKITEMQTVQMLPVHGGSEASDENKKFWAATPGGRIEVNCVFPESVAAFPLGSEVYVDFTPVEA